MVFEDIPMPLGLPFGSFRIPIKELPDLSFLNSGMNNEGDLDLKTEDGILPLNDYLDVTLTGFRLFTGYLGIDAISQYMKRYKYSGQFSAQY